MPSIQTLSRLAPIALFVLAACSRGEDKRDDNRDPVAQAALNDPILADPDLAAQNKGNAALTGGGPADGNLPPFKNTPEEAEAARDAAEQQLGTAITAAPAPSQTAAMSKLTGAATVMAAAELSGLGSKDCLRGFAFSASWAAHLPLALQVYPRGHTLAAGGFDSATCKLRAVKFVTPVTVSDVIDYYFASASKAKLPVQRRREGEDEVLAGSSGGAGYAVYVRRRPDGMSEVDLITSGL